VRVIHESTNAREHRPTHSPPCCPPQVSRQSLEAIHALGSHHTACVRGGQPGLHGQLAAAPDLLSRLLCDVLALTVGQLPCPTELRHPAADALLALIAADTAGYTTTVQQLLARQPSPDVSARLAAEFAALTSANGVNASLVRANLAVFRRNFDAFVERVRSFTVVK
jgi:hypothetical protein